MPLDVIVAVRGGGHDLPEHVRRKVAHDLPEIPQLTTASARHPAILAPRPERRTHAPHPYPAEPIPTPKGRHRGHDYARVRQASRKRPPR